VVIAIVTAAAYTLDMAEIRSTDDFLHVLREHPEWKEAVRRELLTEELLNIPSIVSELAQAQNRTESSMESLNVKVESLIDHQAGMQSSLTDLVQMTARGLATMESGFGEVRDGFRVVDQRFDQVDQRLDHVDQRLDQVDQRLDHVDQRLDQVDQRFEQMDGLIGSLYAKFTAKLDQISAEIRDIKRHLGI